MTPGDLRAEVTARTNLPRLIVGEVLDRFEDVLRDAILRGQEINVGKLIRIGSTERNMSVRLKPTGDRVTVRKILLTIKPRKPFRKELDQWLSLKNTP